MTLYIESYLNKKYHTILISFPFGGTYRFSRNDKDVAAWAYYVVHKFYDQKTSLHQRVRACYNRGINTNFETISIYFD